MRFVQLVFERTWLLNKQCLISTAYGPKKLRKIKLKFIIAGITSEFLKSQQASGVLEFELKVACF